MNEAQTERALEIYRRMHGHRVINTRSYLRRTELREVTIRGMWQFACQCARKQVKS